MRIFGNINGIDILYSDLHNDGDKEYTDIVVVGYSLYGKKRSARCTLPFEKWEDVTNFEDATLEYLKGIITYHEARILEESKLQRGREYKEMIPIKINDKEVMVKKDFLDNN